MKRIVWIASYPKSGNTWVRLFIAALRHRMTGAEAPYDANAIAGEPDFHQDNARRLYEPLLNRGWDAATKADMAHARPVVHEWIAKSARKATPIVKTHNANIKVHGVPLISPNVTRSAIYIVRHPFDVAVSVKDHFGARDYGHAIEQMVFKNYVQVKDARFVDAPVGSWSQNVRSWTETPNSKIHVVRYEDLLSDPAQHFTRIAAILGANDQAKIEMAISDVDIAALQALETANGFVETSSRAEKFFARGVAGMGDQLLNDDEKSSLRKGAAGAAQLHGYEL